MKPSYMLVQFSEFSGGQANRQITPLTGLLEYIDWGAEDERGLRDNRRAFDCYKIKPLVLGAEVECSTDVTLFGQKIPFTNCGTSTCSLCWYCNYPKKSIARIFSLFAKWRR
jgi:hypothetical protein